jgi:succinate dehydrogenase / fumarate reductase cytochrome b subunit
MEHMLTNSQAALFFGADGNGFVRAVNFLHNLPFLPLIEGVLLGVPILFHGVLGIRYALSAKSNNKGSDGSSPAMKGYNRNKAYTWQRLTSWVILFGIIAHVSYMRFYIYPVSAKEGNVSSYFVRLKMDPGLYTLSKRLGVTLYDTAGVAAKQGEIKDLSAKINAAQVKEEEIHSRYEKDFFSSYKGTFSTTDQKIYEEGQLAMQKKEWIAALGYRHINASEVIAVSTSFGDVILLNVRDSFKSPITAALYTIFVIATCFHAFNGLWTFCISWGIILKMRSQNQALNLCIALMVLIALLGLTAIWGSYFINLKH